jgi:uncharacterized protein (TIGR02145 family)
LKSKFIISLLLLLIISVLSCKKEPEPGLAPAVTTEDITNVGGTNATSGGAVVSQGSDRVFARGICWSTKVMPATIDTKIYSKESEGAFKCTITGLNGATTYYVRAFAINSTGIGYGEVKSFTTLGDAPIAETLPASYLGSKTATLNGSVNANYLQTNVKFEWGETMNYGNSEMVTYLSGNSTSAVSKDIKNLTKSTLYHFRVVAVNPKGTKYGNDMTFTTSDANIDAIFFNPDLTYGSVSDIDGNTYKTIKIGTQTWMAENLKTTKYNDGTFIAYLGCTWYKNDIGTYKDVYGALYSWDVVNPVMNPQKNVCPAGWHVPGETEWNLLSTYLGGANSAGGKLKETGTMHWVNTNTGATNETGFTALPGGYNKNGVGNFLNLGAMGFWWSTTIDNISGLPLYWIMYNNESDVGSSVENKNSGLSVRCVRDN